MCIEKKFLFAFIVFPIILRSWMSFPGSRHWTDRWRRLSRYWSDGLRYKIFWSSPRSEGALARALRILPPPPWNWHDIAPKRWRVFRFSNSGISEFPGVSPFSGDMLVSGRVGNCWWVMFFLFSELVEFGSGAERCNIHAINANCTSFLARFKHRWDTLQETRQTATGWKEYYSLGVSPTHDASEIIISSFLWRAPKLNLHKLHC